MTRMGLRNLVCVISSGSTTEASSSERSCGSEQAEGDQEYSPSSEGAAATAAAAPSLSSKCMNSSSSRESWHGGGHDHHGRASAAATVAHEPVSPASGGNHMFSCFHACAINLVQTHLLMNPLSSTNFFVFVFFFLSFPSSHRTFWSHLCNFFFFSLQTSLWWCSWYCNKKLFFHHL